ncbi:hypothetical protein C1H76_5472 [Elsinoe australis]|uniref:Uncharacterized protein n=1 Tax=Elsinoe australis TaxID=40998 RepID=A0A4U7B2S8_9PEZI|nr:hypothetical protein C1H76_5472 [Elsinoe australis]
MNNLQIPLALARHSLAPERMLALRQLTQHGPSSLRIPSRAASTAKPIKARVLEQPDKFRPPSHPAKLRTNRPAYPGPSLSQQEKESQKRKQYPHMMPPEGTFMHKFLTSRSLHTWITLSVLVSLAFFTILTNFLHTTPYKDQLPPNNLFFSHPIRFVARWWEVYQMHTDYITQETIARREAKVDDVKKRGEYRKAHGIDEEAGIGGWTFRTDKKPETLADAAVREGGEQSVVEQSQVGKNEYVDFSGEKKQVKKWFGIW